MQTGRVRVVAAPLVTNVVRGRQEPDRLLLLIHGKGADEHDLEPLIQHLDPEGRFLTVLPRAPFPFLSGYHWYETDGIPKGGPEFLSSVDALDDLLDSACAEHGFQRSQAIVAGFSQGCALTLALGLRRSDRPRPAGLLAMSGFLPEREGLEYDFSAAPPVLVQHGTADPTITVDYGRRAVARLGAEGVPVVYREYAMAHQVALESVQDAMAWLALVLAGERPTEPVPDFEGAAGAGAAEAGAGAETEAAAEHGLVRAVTSRTFESEVLRSDLPVIVDFWAPWCQPCLMVAPIVEQIAAMRARSYRVVKVNIDEEPAIADAYDVKSIPMIALFRGGRLERASLGAKPRPALEADLGMLVIP
jgi:phospholipase/carboxylesterase